MTDGSFGIVRTIIELFTVDGVIVVNNATYDELTFLINIGINRVYQLDRLISRVSANDYDRKSTFIPRGGQGSQQ